LCDWFADGLYRVRYETELEWELTFLLLLPRLGGVEMGKDRTKTSPTPKRTKRKRKTPKTYEGCLDFWEIQKVIDQAVKPTWYHK